MARFAMPPGPYGTERVNGITITGGAANTKGAWTDVVASLSRDISGFYLAADGAVGQSGLNTSTLIDIGVGSTGDAVDDTLIADIPVGYSNQRSRVYFPLHVRKGERLAARIQGFQASETFPLDAFLCYAPPPPLWAGFARGENITPMNLSTSSPTYGNISSSGTEIVASTSRFYRAFNWWPACVGTGGNSNEQIVELRVGGSGSEQVIGRWSNRQTNTEIIEVMIGPLWLEYPTPAGSRLSVIKSGTGNLTGAFAGYW